MTSLGKTLTDCDELTVFLRLSPALRGNGRGGQGENCIHWTTATSGLPFGLYNAPTFDKLMELVLRSLPLTTCLVYLEDIGTADRSQTTCVASVRCCVGSAVPSLSLARRNLARSAGNGLCQLP